MAKIKDKLGWLNDPDTRKVHGTWHDFCNYMRKWYFIKRPTVHFRKKEIVNGKRLFKEFAGYKMVGYQAMRRVERYVEKHPEIKLVTVDDSFFAGSMIVLIPHPKMGITLLYIPQCGTDDTNQCFLYPHHSRDLMNELTSMKKRHGI